jgi:HTH-type transcriptional regulator/antitoxin HigA
MDNDIRLVYEPLTVTHPGETVVDYLEFNGWSQRDLARRIGLTPKTISEICNGKAPISPTTALALELVFKRPAHFWLNLQVQFDEAEARRNATAKLKEWQDWAEQFPLKALKQYKWLEVKEPYQSEVTALLNFLGVSSPESWKSVWNASHVAYRQTRKFRTSIEAISAWGRASELLAEQFAEEHDIKEFDENRFKSALNTIRKLTGISFGPAKSEMESLCAAAGVIVVIVPELPFTGISGCARWLSDKRAFIGLTLRYRTDDQFWFTFFHEAAHILLHRKKYVFILDNAADNLMDKVVDPEMQKQEEEANRFAADTLIPSKALSQFIQKKDFSNDAIHQFAEEQGIGPGIVVGRLQHDKVLGQYQGNHLKQKLIGKLPG